jgi:Protein of unknown function (DUF707)
MTPTVDTLARLSRDRPELWATSGAHRNLVIVRAGRGSLHPGWLDGAAPAEFDILVASYEAGTPEVRHSQSYAVSSPGPKVAGYADLFRRHPELLEFYDYIALFDDDIRIAQKDIERLFRIGRQYGLDLFQPALSHDSYFSYAATLAHRNFKLRFTNTVEMMCPVFSVAHLRRALPLFELGYETGIDLLWTRLLDDPWRRFAIIDDVVATHTRPVGARKDLQGFRHDEPYEEQMQAALTRFGVTFRGFVTYEGIDREGRAVRSRRRIAMHSVANWAAVLGTPLRKLDFAWLATDFTRHCLFRPINLRRIDVAAARAGSH